LPELEVWDIFSVEKMLPSIPTRFAGGAIIAQMCPNVHDSGVFVQFLHFFLCHEVKKA
jgi:hypothetical protein